MAGRRGDRRDRDQRQPERQAGGPGGGDRARRAGGGSDTGEPHPPATASAIGDQPAHGQGGEGDRGLGVGGRAVERERDGREDDGGHRGEDRRTGEPLGHDRDGPLGLRQNASRTVRNATTSTTRKVVASATALAAGPGSVLVHVAMAPRAPIATPISTNAGSCRRRPIVASTAAAVRPVTTAASWASSPVRPRCPRVPEPANPASLDEGEQRAQPGETSPARGQRVAMQRHRQQRRCRRAPAGRGRRTRRRCPPPGRRPPPPNALRSTTERSRCAPQPNATVAAAPWPQEPLPSEVGSHADGGDVEGHEEDPEVEQRSGRRRQGGRRLRPPSGRHRWPGRARRAWRRPGSGATAWR